MAFSWSDVESTPTYKEAPELQKKEIQKAFFDDVLRKDPTFPVAQANEVEAAFYKSITEVKAQTQTEPIRVPVTVSGQSVGVEEEPVSVELGVPSPEPSIKGGIPADAPEGGLPGMGMGRDPGARALDPLATHLTVE